MTAAMKLKDAPWKKSYDKLSILKITNFIWLTKVCIVKAMAFPVVLYGGDSWTVNKVECRRTDAFEPCGAREDSRESLGLQGDPTSPS